MAEGAFALPDGQPFDAHGGVSGYSMHTLRVIFVEVEVDEALGRARIHRCVAGYSAGHLVNPCTARSQTIGRLIWAMDARCSRKAPWNPRYGLDIANLFGFVDRRR